MTIVTSHLFPPIPDRSHDWVAYFDGEEEGLNGFGRTELNAVTDLIMQRDEQKSERIEALEELVAGAAILVGFFRGYLGPAWFEILHDAQLEYPDRIEAEAAAIAKATGKEAP